VVVQSTVPDFFQEETADALRAQVGWLVREVGVDDSFFARLGHSSMGPAYTRCASTPSPRNRGRVILIAGRGCLDSALQWWLRLLGVFPEWDSEPGSVFGPITGDPDPVSLAGIAWFPFATLTWD
jgi:hypothetical protein